MSTVFFVFHRAFIECLWCCIYYKGGSGDNADCGNPGNSGFDYAGAVNGELYHPCEHDFDYLLGFPSLAQNKLA